MGDVHSAESHRDETIVIVGVGLIGGSIAAARKKRGFGGRIIGVGRNRARLETARNTGLIDQVTTHLADAAQQADLMIFCTPVDLIAEGVKAAAPHCRRYTLLTDAGSVKQTICQKICGFLPQGVTFIGSHPLAGSEKNGFEYADPDLFDGRVCVVTPDESTDALSRLTVFWQSLGLCVVEMSASDHDKALARTSHVPHVVAAALASSLSESNRLLASSGFADTTRIASGDPDLWVAILLANADEVVRGIEAHCQTLDEFRESIANRDATALKKLLQLAKTKRDGWEATRR